MKRVIIAGSRGFTGGRNYGLLRLVCDTLIGDNQVTILTGMAGGADRQGFYYATNKGIPFECYPADWDKHGKSAGYIRNLEMAEKADTLIAFWDGVSRGTNHMIDIAKERGLEVFVYDYVKRQIRFTCNECNRLLDEVDAAFWGDGCSTCGRPTSVLIRFD